MPANLDFVLVFSEYAKQDIREISVWYRNELVGLDERFLLSLETSIDSLKSNPFAYQICFGAIRAVLLSRFPYRLYYYIENSAVIIIGVFHTKRSTRLIRKRSKIKQ